MVSLDACVMAGLGPVLGGFLRGAEEDFWHFARQPLLEGSRVLGAMVTLDRFREGSRGLLTLEEGKSPG